ncbi:MAG: nucleoside triphosphate pyrophosphohydrolase family protein [Clostridia bacterium]
MKINEYQDAAMRTANATLTFHEQLQNGIMGLCGESGECADILKKYLFQGHPLDPEHIAKELGDIAWYLSLSATAIGYDLETILQMNVDKLKARYPDGFNTEQSLHRNAEDI